MGNSNSHFGERRKSVSNSHNNSHQHHSNRTSGLTIGDIRLTPYADVGPVDITKSTTKPIPSSTPSPRSNQDNVSISAPTSANRPRAGTVSGPRRQNYNDVKRENSKYNRKLPTIFKYNGHAKEVYVSGSFNGWKKMPMVRSQKDFVAIVELQEGDHQYKFMVDGEWINDQNAPTVINEKGVKYNKIHVQKEDFDAYDALDMDSEAVSKLQHKNRGDNFCNEFGQEIPHSNAFEHRSGPPILPPHLLQVILNKDTPLSCEPTLLPEPHHVMLNHLYALSIKDGVMVLSSTQRYRKKYVTTLLYKPMGVRKEE